MEIQTSQSFPDVSNFMVQTYMDEQEQEIQQSQESQNYDGNEIKTTIKTLDDKVSSVVVDFENMFSILNTGLNNVLNESKQILTQLSTILDFQRQETQKRESILEEQFLLNQNRDSNVEMDSSLEKLSDLLDEMALSVSSIQFGNAQSNIAQAIKGMPKWVIGTLIAMGVITAAQVGLPESDDEAGYVDTDTVSSPSLSPSADENVDGKTLSDLIAGGESKGDYNVYNYRRDNGKFGIKTGNLEGMTINQILSEQKKGKMYAVGKYQMIPITLNEGKNRLKLSGEEKFDAAMQERLFKQYLVGSKRPAVRDYISGKSDDIESALTELALEFRSVSTTYGKLTSATKAGRGDKASISRESAAEALKIERDLYRKRQRQMLSEQILEDDPITPQDNPEKNISAAEAKRDGITLSKNSSEVVRSKITESKNIVNIISSSSNQRQVSDSTTKVEMLPAINMRSRVVA
jgi:hypothetical protein